MTVRTSKVVIMVCLLVIGTFSMPDFMDWLTSTIGWVCLIFFVMYYAKYGTFDLFIGEPCDK